MTKRQQFRELMGGALIGMAVAAHRRKLAAMSSEPNDALEKLLAERERVLAKYEQMRRALQGKAQVRELLREFVEPVEQGRDTAVIVEKARKLAEEE